MAFEVIIISTSLAQSARRRHLFGQTKGTENVPILQSGVIEKRMMGPGAAMPAKASIQTPRWEACDCTSQANDAWKRPDSVYLQELPDSQRAR